MHGRLPRDLQRWHGLERRALLPADQPGEARAASSRGTVDPLDPSGGDRRLDQRSEEHPIGRGIPGVDRPPRDLGEAFDAAGGGVGSFHGQSYLIANHQGE